MFTLLNFNPQCSYWRIWDECVILFIFSYFKQNQVVTCYRRFGILTCNPAFNTRDFVCFSHPKQWHLKHITKQSDMNQTSMTQINIAKMESTYNSQ